MAITDPTIDPVTGLPVLDTSGIVQQIPLGRQTVDYAGWNATAQPTRTPLYPDDVIPVFANVQGQHPQTGNAQNVTTDGEGRMNVHIFPSGGGGGGTVVSTPYQVLSHESTTPFPLGPYHASYTTGFKLYAFRYSLALTPPLTVANQNRWMRFYCNDDLTGDKWDITTDTVYMDAASNTLKPIFQGYVTFNPLWDLLATLTPNQVSPLSFLFQFGGSGTPSFSGSFALHYVDA